MKSYISVSLSDLITTKEWLEAERDNDSAAKKKILWMCGLDVNHPDGVEEEVVEHRNWQKQIVKCVRFTGVERTDQEWLRSGLATMEGHMAAASADVRMDMIKMNRQSKYSFVFTKDDGGDE